jgi:prolyl 4-hydroxylase
MATPSDLESQAAAGDAGAQFALGETLMAQANSLEKFERAAGMIAESANRGHGEASCMLATLEAVGAGRPRDWGRALEHLETAAARGSEHARGQLRLLAGVSDPAGNAQSAGAEEDWGALRTRINIERLLRAPAPSALSERPRLRVFREFARNAECRWVIDRLRPKLRPAAVWDETSGGGVVDDYRSNSAAEVPVHDMDVVIALLRARISEATRLPEFIFEIPQLMHYAVGEEFRPHHDFLDPSKPGFAADIARRGQRMGTFLLFLNEDFEGGETEFPKAGISFRGRPGDALFFANVTRDGQPDPLTLHAGRAPTRGDKWILSQWIRERPPTG